jgi:2-polyprenyl-3-methyl-5-hydroxy-6-metoxy-1,4-benzoquinol methylase
MERQEVTSFDADQPARKQEYQKEIEQESLFWGRKAEAQLQAGIPWEIDRRQAVRIEGSVSDPWLSSSDPLVHEVWRGEFLNSVLSRARASGQRALELGCGTGWLSLELARMGMTVIAVDVSEKSIEIAKGYLEENPLPPDTGSIDYQVEDLNTIVLPEGAYDCIISFSTLHHVPGIERLIRECHKALKDRGVLIVLDHVREGRRNAILEACVRLLLLPVPACYPLPRRIKDVLGLFLKGIIGPDTYEQVRRLYKERRDTATSGLDTASPFEEVTGYETVNYIRQHFDIDEMTFRKSFRARRIVSDLKLEDRSKRSLTQLLRHLDEFLCRTGLIPGMGVYIVGRKT